MSAPARPAPAAGAADAPSPSAGKPLDGRLVVAVEQAVAAPCCSSRLADAGARVLKIERPGGDFARGHDRARLQRLVAAADVHRDARHGVDEPSAHPPLRTRPLAAGDHVVRMPASPGGTGWDDTGLRPAPGLGEHGPLP